jgi:hypothetical protein
MLPLNKWAHVNSKLCGRFIEWKQYITPVGGKEERSEINDL